MKISYNLTKRTTKTEKFERCFKLFGKIFKVICYKLTASGNINPELQAYETRQQFTAT